MNQTVRARRDGGSHRGVRLSARLPVDLRARSRAHRRAHHRPRARRQGQRLHARRHLRQGRALCRARASSRPRCCIRCAASARKARANSAASPGTTRSIWSPRNSSKREQRHGAESVWPYYYAGTMGLVMRDGINRLRHAKKYSGFHSTICVNPAYAGFAAGDRQDRRRRSARNGEVGSGGDLGHQCGQHAGQRDDARDARAQGARRQDRGGRRLHERHHGAGRPAGAGEARHRRRARLRGDALPVPRRQGRLGLSRTNTPTRRANSKRICARAIRPGRRRSPARRSRPSRHSPS